MEEFENNVRINVEYEHLNKNDLSYYLNDLSGRFGESIVSLSDYNNNLIEKIVIEKSVKLAKIFIHKYLNNINYLNFEILFNTITEKKHFYTKFTFNMGFTDDIKLCVSPYPEIYSYNGFLIYIENLYK